MVRSLRLRLLIAAALSIFVALTLAGAALSQLFERHVSELVDQELQRDLRQLAGSLAVAPDGAITAGANLANVEYAQPLSGSYWWVVEETAGGPQERAHSRSLWDAAIPDGRTGMGPEGEPLIVSHRTVALGAGATARTLTLYAARHDTALLNPLAAFQSRLMLYLLPLGLALMLASWAQVAVGLRPLQALRQEVKALGADPATGKRITGHFPAEVAPLVSELNTVLDLRDTSLARARKRAGDLAHGLKTPLTILSAVAEDVRASGLARPADEIEEAAAAMVKQVDHALARARLSTGHGLAATNLAAIAQRIIATLKRLPDSERLTWRVDVPAGTALHMEEGDLTELLGNLLDNARKWARGAVRLAFEDGTLLVEDDGPGVPDGALEAIARRGLRLDESKQGSGLGLAIIADIADLYGLTLQFGRSPLGGLRVSLGRAQG